MFNVFVVTDAFHVERNKTLNEEMILILKLFVKRVINCYIQKQIP